MKHKEKPYTYEELSSIEKTVYDLIKAKKLSHNEPSLYCGLSKVEIKVAITLLKYKKMI